MNFYKILKIKKLGRGSPDFWTRLFAKHTGGGSVKPVIVELTGRLPLSFNTSDTKLHDWTIRGNNDVGKNLFEITVESQTTHGVTFAVDKQAGTITTSGSTTTYAVVASTVRLQPGNYIFTCDDNSQRDITFDSYVRTSGKTLARDNNSDPPGNAFTIDEEKTVYVYNRISAGTGDMPHVFKPMIRRVGTSEAFEPYQIGVGERTKNLLEITAESRTIAGVKYTVDKQAGTVTATRVSASTNNSTFPIDIPDELSGQNLYFSGCPSEGSANTCDIYALDYNTATRAPQWDGTTISATDYGTSDNNEVRFVEGHRSQIRLRIKADYDAQNIVFKPMLRPANTTSDFIPYGYQIPLITMDAKTAEYVYRTNIFIGDSPLTEGESVSKSSTGLDVKTIAIGADDYPNKLITSLSNAPEMTIKYKTKGGS